RGVVAHANHGIGAMLAGVLQKKLEGILARSLAQIRKKSDIAAPNRLQRSPKISDQAARAHHDSANDPEIPHNPIPRQIQPASNHSRIDSWHLSLLEEMERLMKPSFTTVDGCDSSRFIRAPGTILLCYSLKESGNTLLHTGNHPDHARRLSRPASHALARLRAPAAVRRSRILRAARGRALPMHGYRAGARAQPGFVHGIRSPSLPTLSYP